MIRVVLDTSVIVAGPCSSAGASQAVLEQLSRGRFDRAASPPLFLEYEQVLKRSDHRIPPDQVDGFLAELARIIKPVQIRYSWRPQLLDADDEMVLEVAINGHVEAIVTHNKRDFVQAAGRFGISVWEPAELLWRLRQKKEK